MVANWSPDQDVYHAALQDCVLGCWPACVASGWRRWYDTTVPSQQQAHYLQRAYQVGSLLPCNGSAPLLQTQQRWQLLRKAQLPAVLCYVLKVKCVRRCGRVFAARPHEAHSLRSAST